MPACVPDSFSKKKEAMPNPSFLALPLKASSLWEAPTGSVIQLVTELFSWSGSSPDSFSRRLRE